MSTQVTQQGPADIRTAVREQYGAFARQGAARCCGDAQGARDQCSDAGGGTAPGVIQLYETPDATALPAEVTDLALGCGDPVTLAGLKPGQTVLDLGSGGGIDCFLAAQKVGPTGRVIGVDMTADMLERARANKARLGAENVEFRLGEIEHLPVADCSVDVVISNCVINLSPDKPQVFREALRVLRPGGRLAVSDIVTDGPLPDEVRRDLRAWAGCVAGAWDARDYAAAIRDAGFVDVELTPVPVAAGVVQEVAVRVHWAEGEPGGTPVPKPVVYSAKVTAGKPS